MITIDLGDTFAGLALLLSSYAIWQTHKFNKKQKNLIESQERLNEVLLEKEASELKKEKSADVSASIITVGSKSKRLKIWNKGQSSARNIIIEFPEGNEIFSESDIQSKFPLENLEKYQSVEIHARSHFGTKSKHLIKLKWEDDSNDNNEKNVYVTV